MKLEENWGIEYCARLWGIQYREDIDMKARATLLWRQVKIGGVVQSGKEKATVKANSLFQCK